MALRLRYLLAILLLAGSLSLQAQTGEQRHNLSLGVSGGVNLSRVIFSPKIQQKDLAAPVFGITARYISERWFGMLCGVQMELNFSQRGWNEHYDDYPELMYKRKTSYLEVPALMHIGFGKEHGFLKFFIHGGPQFGYYLSDSSEIDGDWINYRYHQEQHTLDVEHKFDYGIVGGAGFEFHTGIGNFLLEGRYYYGLSDIYGNTKKDYFSRSANTYTSIRLTYLLDILK